MKKRFLILFAGLTLAVAASAQLIITTSEPVVVPQPTLPPVATTTPVLQQFIYLRPKSQVRIDIGAGVESYTTTEFATAATNLNISIDALAASLSAIREEMLRVRAEAAPTP